MSEYRRVVSYIYSYPGGVRDANVGFAKAEVRGGVMGLNVVLCGMQCDAPQCFGVYLLFDRDKGQQTYSMLPIGKIVINAGKGKYQDILNPDNLASSGYNFTEIRGIGVLTDKDRYYMCFSLWEADEINPSKCVYLPEGYKRVVDKQRIAKGKVSEETVGEVECEKSDMNYHSSGNGSNESKNDFISAFDDDYYFDCREITPGMLKELVPGEVDEDNSFVMHAYYTYRHLLFGRVADNDNGSRYFIGIPGMYSNKERYLATMFGFNNFKRSIRSDYANPYFGYWYREV